MEAKAIELFKRFSQVTVLYRTDDGEYFIELDDCQAYLTIRGSGTYSTVERTTPLPTLPTPWAEPPLIWGVVNNPLAYNATPETNPVLYPHILIYNVSVAGTYTNFRDSGNVNLAVSSGDLDGGLVQFRWEGGWKKTIIPIPSGMGAVEYGELRSVSGDEVARRVVLKSTVLANNLRDDSYVMDETVVASNGVAGTNSTNYALGKSIVKMPLPKNKRIIIDGLAANVNRYYGLLNESNEVIKSGNITSTPFVIETTNEAYRLNLGLKMIVGSLPDSSWDQYYLYREDVPLANNSESRIYEVDGKELIAKQLGAGNSVPDPLFDENAVNLKTLKESALSTEDLTVEASINLARQEDGVTIVFNKYIANNGIITNGMGWVMYKLDVSFLEDGTQITFGNFVIQDGGYSSFYNGETMVLYNGSHTGVIGKTVTKPADATILYIGIKRPTGANDYSQLIINLGSILSEYVSPLGKVKKIKGMELKVPEATNDFFSLRDVAEAAGNSRRAIRVNGSEDGLEYFDALEKEPNMSFENIKANVLEVVMVDFNDVPIWDESTSALIGPGEMYLKQDGDHFIVKVRGA